MLTALMAQTFARTFHAGQKRDSGKPYISHPEVVVSYIHRFARDTQQFTISEDLIAIGWMHDLLEDTRMPRSLIKKVFSPYVVEGMDALTHRKDLGETKDQYVDRLKIAKPDFRYIKHCDTLHNIITLGDKKDYSKRLKRIEIARDWNIPDAHEICPMLGAALEHTVHEYMITFHTST